MRDILIALLIAAPVAFVLAKIILAINGKDDGQPWPHMNEQDEHRWE